MPALLAAWEAEAGLCLEPRCSGPGQSAKIESRKEKGVGEIKGDGRMGGEERKS